MKTILLLAVLGLAIASSGSMYGVDIGEGSGVVSESALSCMKSAGKDFVIFEAWDCGYGIIEAVAENVKNAQAAGFQYIDIYGFFAPGCGNDNSPASGAIQKLHSWLESNGVKYGTFWLDVEPLSGVWDSESENINYVASLADEASSLGMTVGVYSSEGSWGGVCGSETSESLSKLPLWYAHYDNDPSYSDGSQFYGFGGWSKPAMKQYNGDTTLCGIDVDLDWTGDINQKPSSGGKPTSNSKPSSGGQPSKGGNSGNGGSGNGGNGNGNGGSGNGGSGNGGNGNGNGGSGGSPKPHSKPSHHSKSKPSHSHSKPVHSHAKKNHTKHSKPSKSSHKKSHHKKSHHKKSHSHKHKSQKEHSKEHKENKPHENKEKHAEEQSFYFRAPAVPDYIDELVNLFFN